jgi:L-alanine-DL-glutamate epimerase-like enolase superfamily enzyme
MAVCLDETIESESDVIEVLATDSADELSLKLNRHGLIAFQRMLKIAADNGIGVRIGGTFDTAVGRLHLLAAAGLANVVDAAVGPPSGYLASDIATYPTMSMGSVTPLPDPGIGVDPSPEALAELGLRSMSVDVTVDSLPSPVES